MESSQQQMQEVDVKAGPVSFRGVFKDLNTAATLAALAGVVALCVGFFFHYDDSKLGRGEFIGAIKEQTAAIKQSTEAQTTATQVQQESNCLQLIKGTSVDPAVCRRTVNLGGPR